VELTMTRWTLKTIDLEGLLKALRGCLLGLELEFHNSGRPRGQRTFGLRLVDRGLAIVEEIRHRESTPERMEPDAPNQQRRKTGRRPVRRAQLCTASQGPKRAVLEALQSLAARRKRSR